MTSPKNGKIPTYDPKLYATCQYIIQNSEKFMNYAILKNRIPLAGDNNYLDLHNGLINIFYFLTGKRQKTNKNGAAKGSDVMAALCLNELPEDKLAMILTLFYEYTHENHKSMEQIFNVNVEKAAPLLNALIEILNQDYIGDIQKIISTLKMQSEQESIEENNYIKALDIVYNIYKSEIIKYRQSYFIRNVWNALNPLQNDIYFYHKILLENNTYSNLEYAKNMRSLERKYPQFRNLKKSYYTWLYCDLCCHSLLDLVTGLLTEKSLTFSVKELERLNAIILELIKENSPQCVEAKGKPEEILFYFSSYYHTRDMFLQDINILKYITENCGKRENPDSKYILSNPLALERE